jgi:iron(III) transport system substrate-binding protein
MSTSGKLGILLALAIVLGLPFILRKEAPVRAGAEDRVVVITPHTESIRHEFGRGFEKWYEARTGRSVYVDFRVIGGTSEISKFLDSEFTNSFRNYWVNDLGREWTVRVQEAMDNARLQLDETPTDDTEEEAARRAFLSSTVSSGIDVFFGGGDL